MLSTFSSLLPSVLSDKLDKLQSRPEVPKDNQPTNLEEENIKVKDMADNEDGPKKEKKKKVTSHETFIVVRPPPAMSNHPLNLQLQLVPAQHSRDRPSTSTPATPTNRQFTIDTNQANEGAPGQSPPSPSESDQGGHHRTPSTRSNRSETSMFYASSAAAASGSVTSFASTASTSSGRRMIIPLYNLSAHNVMTNTVLDAGTDARVAKFLKRGLEIIDLAILEPTEVWAGKQQAHGAGVGGNSDAYGIPVQRSVSGNSSLAPPGQNSRAATPELPHSPGSSRVSVSSDHSKGDPRPTPSDTTMTPAATPTGAKKFFGKIFKKKESSGSGAHVPSPSITVHPATRTPPQSTIPLPDARSPTVSRQQTLAEALLPAVLGLSPTLSAATNPPTGRCVSYVWIVRKWLKSHDQGVISGMLGKIGREAASHGIGNAGVIQPGDWEVRFEWSRGKSKEEKARKKARTSDNGLKNGSRTPSRRNSALIGQDGVQGNEVIHESPRQSLDVKKPTVRAPSPRSDAPKAHSVTSQSDDDTANGHGEDAGEESDPEDSETPWICSLILTHSSAPLQQPASAFSKGHSRSRTISSSHNIPTTPTPANSSHFPPRPSTSHGTGEGTGFIPVKLKVATLSPAPHHPKVVCQLKIPFPLPDIEVEHGTLRKRVVLADGTTRSTVPVNEGMGVGIQGLTLTAEEIKDVVCSTAFWIVVREGFGGVGKKNRKGDGWKIRG